MGEAACLPTLQPRIMSKKRLGARVLRQLDFWSVMPCECASEPLCGAR
jgi:hypothetical protein